MTGDSGSSPALLRVAEWLGIQWAQSQTEQLQRYTDWLGTEGIAVGGLGPAESQRLWTRHILDSLLFAKGMPALGSVIDMGSGVGLPGVPIAIAHPGAQVTLVDRSGRRVDAASRVAAILGCDIEIVHEDVRRIERQVDWVVSRASLPPGDAIPVAADLLVSGGEARVGLGREPDDRQCSIWRAFPAPDRCRLEVLPGPTEVLDSARWMLRIVRT